MKKYYTRACNFYYGDESIKKIRNKSSLPLSNNKLISFDTLEIITRNYKKSNQSNNHNRILKLNQKPQKDR